MDTLETHAYELFSRATQTKRYTIVCVNVAIYELDALKKKEWHVNLCWAQEITLKK